MTQPKKTAVVLFNLGGPNRREDIKPFLFNFFMDKNIIRAPVFVRFFLAKLISIRRSKKEAGDSYGLLGNKSPLLENSTAQAQALENVLNSQLDGEFKCYIAMRYWHPNAMEVAQNVAAWNPDEIMLLPLYPQFSTTTTRSSFQQWDVAKKALGMRQPETRICCYPWQEGFVKASAENIKKVYDQAVRETGQKPRVLFSAHGLPEKVIADGDPYQWQCEQSAAQIAAALNIPDLDWQICYQSRVGPLKWIGPSTEEALEKAAHDKVPVVILPHAFTQEHVETLVEIEIEYREKAEEMGLHHFYRVPTVGTSPAFISGLADMVRQHADSHSTQPDTGAPLCPADFKECCARQAQKVCCPHG